MKKIHLVRHAKSSWDNSSLPDIDRPLSDVGISACRFMAEHIHDAGCCFDHIFCSPAVRAQSTITLISESLPESSIEWSTVDELYTFDYRNLFSWVKTVDDSIDEILLIGHNPAFTDFCNELSDSDIRNIPTCGYAQLAARQDFQWNQLSGGKFELTRFLRPKKLME
jgi:phosphohistidine phosphatase